MGGGLNRPPSCCNEEPVGTAAQRGRKRGHRARSTLLRRHSKVASILGPTVIGGSIRRSPNGRAKISPRHCTRCPESCGAGPTPTSMDERSERHVTHPWLLARQRPQQLDLPPGAEAPADSARLALEAAFVESRAPAPDSHTSASSVGLPKPRTGTAVPAVVIKRKRTFAARDASSAGLTGAAHSDAAAEGDRAPRVFRVDAAPVPITTTLTFMIEAEHPG
jgi:hypothetical protein